MKIEINKNQGINCKLTEKAALLRAKSVINILDKDKTDCTIEVFLVSKEKIKEINKKFLNINRETDILSFPLNWYPKLKEKILGTIFISPEIAEKRNEKCLDLLTHGILHLLGYDHEKNNKRWQEAEKKLERISK